MENIFQTAGTVAGIGGLAIAFVLILFKKILSVKLFPKLNQAQAYRIIRQIIIAAFVLAALGIGAYAYSLSQQNKPAPEQNDGPVNITTHGKNSPAIHESGEGNVNVSFGTDDDKDTVK